MKKERSPEPNRTGNPQPDPSGVITESYRPKTNCPESPTIPKR